MRRRWQQLQQAGAVSVCVVVTSICAARGGESHSAIGLLEFFDNMADAEVCRASDLEGISVRDCSIGAEATPACDRGHISPIGRRERIRYAVSFGRLLGAEQSHTRVFATPQCEIVIIGEGVFHHVAPRNYLHVISWGLTSIFDFNVNDDGAISRGWPNNVLYLSDDIGSQLPFGGFASIFHLAQYDNDKQERRDTKEKREESYGIIDGLVDQPRKAGLISMLLGVLCGTIGITLYLKRGRAVSNVGFALVILGMMAPIIPWWLLILIWWAGD